jgi:hypothetical protein
LASKKAGAGWLGGACTGGADTGARGGGRSSRRGGKHAASDIGTSSAKEEPKQIDLVTVMREALARHVADDQNYIELTWGARASWSDGETSNTVGGMSDVRSGKMPPVFSTHLASRRTRHANEHFDRHALHVDRRDRRLRVRVPGNTAARR